MDLPEVDEQMMNREQHRYEETAKAKKTTGVPDSQVINDDTHLDSDVSALNISSNEKSHSNSPKTEEVTGTKPNASSHFKNTFEEMGVLGRGSFGRVVAVKHKHDEGKYAVKIIPIFNRFSNGHNIKIDSAQIMHEVKYWAKLPRHKTIVEYSTSWSEKYCTLQSDQDDDVRFRDSNQKTHGDGSTESITDDIYSYFFIQMELCKGPLSNIIKKLTAKDIFIVFENIVSALAHMHNHKLMHRDVKPDNILISLDGRAKLGDFGSTKEIKKNSDISRENLMNIEVSSHTSNVGTKYYMAPEMVNSNYDEKADIYSLGITLLEMVCSGNTKEVDSYTSSFADGCGSQKLEIILASSMLVKSSTKRPSANKILKGDLLRNWKKIVLKYA